MQLLLGNGIFKILIDVPFANSNSNRHVQDVKHQGMIASPCKDNAHTIFICIVFSNGLKKVAPINVHLIEKNGFLKIDFLIISYLSIVLNIFKVEKHKI